MRRLRFWAILNLLFELLKQVDVLDLDVKTQRLEDVFMKFYGKEGDIR
jgi:hypothetical protein